MGHETTPGQPERDTGRLYSLDKTVIAEKHSPVSISNGLAWTADNAVLYYIDSVPRQVFAFDFDLANGNVSKSDPVSLLVSTAFQ